MVNTASSYSPKNNRFFDKNFIISNLFIISVVDFKAERKYQNIIKDVWIFDIRSNIHIYNLLKGFTKTRDSDEIIKIGTIFFII